MRKLFKENTEINLANFEMTYVVTGLAYALPILSFILIDLITGIESQVSYYFISIFIATLVYKYKYKDKAKIKKEKMTLKVFLTLIWISYFVIAGIINFIVYPLDYLTKWLFDISFVTDIGIISKEDINAISFCNIVLLGPIFEEIVFRGIGISMTKKYGAEFAIVTTSIVFGMLHIAYPQCFSAFLGGILFGYVYIKYGLKYSILLHCLHNFMCYIRYFINLDPLYSPIYIISAIIFIFMCVIYCIKNKGNIYKPKYSLKQYLIIQVNPYSMLVLLCVLVSLVIMP